MWFIISDDGMTSNSCITDSKAFTNKTVAFNFLVKGQMVSLVLIVLGTNYSTTCCPIQDWINTLFVNTWHIS